MEAQFIGGHPMAGSEKTGIVNAKRHLLENAYYIITPTSQVPQEAAGEIGSHFDMTGATVSYHLKILKKADLIWETKVKNYVYYELNTSVVEELLLWLKDLKGE